MAQKFFAAMTAVFFSTTIIAGAVSLGVKGIFISAGLTILCFIAVMVATAVEKLRELNR